MSQGGPVQEAHPPGLSLLGMFRRRWLLLLVCGAISAAVAYYVGDNYATNSWRFSSRLLYNPSTAGAPHYVPPDLQTMATLVTARETIDQLWEEFALEASPRELARSIQTHTPMSTSTMEVTLVWPNAVQGQAMLERLLELFTERAARTRSMAIKEHLAEFRENLQRSRRTLADANTRLLEFSREHGIIDVQRDLDRLRDEFSSLQLSLELSQVRRDNSIAQLEQLDRMQGEVPQTAPGPAALRGERGSTAAAGARESQSRRMQTALDLQRRSYLQEKIYREQDRQEDAVRLELARTQFERAKRLRERQYISDADFEQFRTELEILEAQHSDQIQGLNNQLHAIDRRMPDILREQALSSAATSMLGRSVAEIELERIASEGEIEHFTEAIAAKQQEIDRVSGIRQRAEELKVEADIATNERQRVETLLATFGQLQHSNMHEFSIVQPAGLALQPFRSNGVKLMFATFLLVGMALSLPLFAAELYRTRERPAEGAARRLGLPVLAKRDTRRRSPLAVRSTLSREFPRLLALRIQQAMHKPGSVLLFSSLSDRPVGISLIASSASCFAQRGERVLLMDIGTTEQNRRELEMLIEEVPEPLESNGHVLSEISRGRIAAKEAVNSVSVAEMEVPLAQAQTGPEQGVADYVVDDACDLDALIHRTRVASVDCIGSGSVSMPKEGLGTRRFADLLDRLRSRYTMILVAGPTTADPVDLAMLAARTEGVVFDTEGSRSANARGEQVIRDLIDVNVPILGFVE